MVVMPSEFSFIVWNKGGVKGWGTEGEYVLFLDFFFHIVHTMEKRTIQAFISILRKNILCWIRFKCK